jgi:hypothetical protein
MKTLIITAVAMSLGLLSSPTFAGGSIVGSHATPIVDPDPAGIGTYLVSAVLLALGIAIFLYILIGEGVQIEDKSKTDERLSLKLALRRDLSSAAALRFAPARLVQDLRWRAGTIPPLSFVSNLGSHMR